MNDAAILLRSFLDEIQHDVVYNDLSEEAIEAKQYVVAIRKMIAVKQKLGMAILQAMWHIYKNQLVIYMGSNGQEYNQGDFRNWAFEEFADDLSEGYLSKIVAIVTKMLPLIHSNEIQNNPFILPSTCERVTVDALLEKSSIEKLYLVADIFLRTAEQAEQENLLDQAMHKSADEVKDYKRTQGKWIRLPYREVQNGNLYTITLTDLTYKQVELFRSLLGKSGEQVFT